MPVTDLATLAQVKAWIPNAPTTGVDDPILGALITSSTSAILTALQRPPVVLRSYVDTFDGYDDTRKMLRRFPVISITALSIYGTSIAPSGGYPAANAGYVLEVWDGQLPGRPQLLDLRYKRYPWGTQNVQVTYQSGYAVIGEVMTVPSGGGAVTALQLNGPWVEDEGVTYQVGGAALVPVASAPATGQYSVSALGVYTFAVGDAGKVVLANYSFVPAPLNQACCDMVSEAYRYRTRIGEKSHTVPGAQTVAFDNSRMTPAVRMMIAPFRMVVPLL